MAPTDVLKQTGFFRNKRGQQGHIDNCHTGPNLLFNMLVGGTYLTTFSLWTPLTWGSFFSDGDDVVWSYELNIFLFVFVL